MDVLNPPAPWFAPYDAACEGVDWQRNHQAAAVDVASFQLWPDDWLVAPEPWKLQWSRRWVRAQGNLRRQSIALMRFGQRRWVPTHQTLVGFLPVTPAFGLAAWPARA
jgi:hypothetical protein